MNKEFVPYDIALAMKELGFDDKCLAVYVGRIDEIHLQTPPINRGYNKKALAPLYQQAFRWFRGELKDSALEPYDIVKHHSYNMKVSWEEAQDACLRKLIEIVKKK